MLGLARTLFGGGFIPFEGLLEIARFTVAFVVQLTQFELGNATAILSVGDHASSSRNLCCKTEFQW
jgi:hypothetical protein